MLQITKIKKRVEVVALIIFFVILSVAFLIPYYWMVVSSFKPLEDIFSTATHFFPRVISFIGYEKLVTAVPYVRWYINSIIFTGGYVILALFLSTLGGFALAKYNFRFQHLIFFIIVGTQMIPFPLLLVPLFIQLAKWKIMNTFPGLIVPFAVNPFGVFFMRQYMLSIPSDLLDAARIDGCSEPKLFYKIALPLARPALAALTIFFAMFAWNALLWPLIVMRETVKFPLTVGIASQLGAYRPQYDLIMAGSFLATLPIIVIFFSMQKHFISGLSAGAIKG